MSGFRLLDELKSEGLTSPFSPRGWFLTVETETLRAFNDLHIDNAFFIVASKGQRSRPRLVRASALATSDAPSEAVLVAEQLVKRSAVTSVECAMQILTLPKAGP